MSFYSRTRSKLRIPVTWGVVLLTLNVALMVSWIVLLVQDYRWVALTIGSIAFALALVGLSFYLFLTIKEVRLNQRQANFVDSVTHELKSPIASLKLYLETLQMRDLDESRREEFYGVMEAELHRLDTLIDHLLEVGRLDAIGHDAEPEDVALEPLLKRCAELACTHHGVDAGVFRFDVEPVAVRARRIVLEMIFGNILDNAIKYAGAPPEVQVQVSADRGRVVTRVMDNGEGVPPEARRKIFQIFFRAGDELHRRKRGTGLGLYIAWTLVHMLKGKISVHDRLGASGSVFVIELPGRVGP